MAFTGLKAAAKVPYYWFRASTIRTSTLRRKAEIAIKGDVKAVNLLEGVLPILSNAMFEKLSNIKHQDPQNRCLLDTLLKPVSTGLLSYLSLRELPFSAGINCNGPADRVTLALLERSGNDDLAFKTLYERLHSLPWIETGYYQHLRECGMLRIITEVNTSLT